MSVDDRIAATIRADVRAMAPYAVAKAEGEGLVAHARSAAART